jgi:hypothetical protein
VRQKNQPVWLLIFCPAAENPRSTLSEQVPESAEIWIQDPIAVPRCSPQSGTLYILRYPYPPCDNGSEIFSIPRKENVAGHKGLRVESADQKQIQLFATHARITIMTMVLRAWIIAPAGNAINMCLNGVPRSTPYPEKPNRKNRRSNGMSPRSAEREISLFRPSYIAGHPWKIQTNIKGFSDMGRAMSYFTRGPAG